MDENFIREMERIIASEDAALSFRQDIVSRVGAYALDNPDKKVDYGKVFSKQIRRLEEHYFATQQKRIQKLHENMLKVLADDLKAMLDTFRMEETDQEQ